jgi:hypothetical protein
MMASTPEVMLDSTAARRNPSSGLVALVMGILGLSVLPVVGPILALVFGYQSRRETLLHPGVYTDDLGRVGRILGWVGLGLAAAGLILTVLAVLFLMPVSVLSA